MTWKPISTAPKDGTRFLAFWIFDAEDLYDDGEPKPERFDQERYQITFWDLNGFGHGYWRDLRDWIDGSVPTHWMPLPPPPGTASNTNGVAMGVEAADLPSF